MKRQITLSLFAAILFVGGMFYSCSKEIAKEDDEMNLKAAKIKVMATIAAPTQADCQTACLGTESASFSKSYTLDYTAGPQGSATVTVTQYATEIVYSITSSTGSDLRKITIDGVDKYSSNTPAKEPFKITVPLGSNWVGCQSKAAVIEVRRNGDGTGGGSYLKFETSYNMISLCTTTSINVDNELPVCIGTPASVTGTVTAGSNDINGGTLQIQELIGTNWTTVASVNVAPGTNTVTYSYNTTVATQTFHAYFDGVNSNGKQSESLGATVTTKVCTPPTSSCTESFSYVTTDNKKTVVFTYVSAIALENASVKFTCPHITGWSSSATLVPNNVNNPTNLTWTGNIEACIPISWTITFTPDCDQNKGNSQNTPSFANVWTDFEVDGVSIKNENTPNIVYNCQ
ncbi:MAG: hypothetical protein Q8R96_16900 [Bacteroidota bacterium]|nr:hypothetical protein [Bacteroidota bacterium]